MKFVVGESALCVRIRSCSFSFDKHSHSLFIDVSVAWLKTELHCCFSAIARFVKAAGIAVAAAIRDSE